MHYIVLMLMALFVSSTSLAFTKVLLLDDIGSGDPSFSWTKAYGDDRVALSAIVNHELCWDQYCYDTYDTGALQGFERRDGEVYYVGTGGGQAPVLCGRTQGFIAPSSFYDACRVSIEPERVCLAWYAADDCVDAVTKRRVYLTINE